MIDFLKAAFLWIAFSVCIAITLAHIDLKKKKKSDKEHLINTYSKDIFL